MRQRDIRLLVLIVILAAFAAWVAWPGNPGIHLRLGSARFDRDLDMRLGLDLQGGMRVLLEANMPADQTVDAKAMEAARNIVENRVNALGVTEPVVQSVGSRRIQVDLPGIKDPEAAIETLKETGLMEWIDTETEYVPPGTVVQTDFGESVEASEEVSPTEKVYHTVLTGRRLQTARVEFDRNGLPVIAFELDSEGAQIFAQHTANNIGKFVAIVLDKKVISCPRIQSAIPEGRGQITGQFSVEEAKSMVLQLRYGALPVPLEVVDTRTVGPTLGEDSVTKSVRAGAIGLVVVLLFMLVYYRLPGFLADLALIIYALLTLTIFKLVPVTLTLPGIAGFLLSVGMAVDANILIFERMREEIRLGRTLQRAIQSGFRRAWTSILDSNVSTWITCLILWLFGNSFGASMVKGFAVTLAIGVFVSMFTAVVATRTFIHAAFAVTGERLQEEEWLLGI
ncbi:MAG: protein translocase subunit SecD [Chloroflexota bacterium]|nr:protein translocase subunit SecD [Chloroflexota bacterium]